MSRRLLTTFVLLALAASAQPGFAQERSDPLLDALTAAKRQGCNGKAGSSGGWRSVQALNQAAARVAQGADADSAARQSGYRARQLFHVRFTGYRSAAEVSRAMGARYCEVLLDPRFSEIGLHRRDANYTILLAAPFDPPAQQDATNVATRVLTLTNAARSAPRRCGEQAFPAAPPLRLNERLARAAAVHAQDMARHSFLEHKGSDGSAVADRVSRERYDWRSVGENIASGQTTPEEVVTGWLRSPGHCENIMESRFTEMGVAFAVDGKSDAGVYWAQVFGRSR